MWLIAIAISGGPDPLDLPPPYLVVSVITSIYPSFDIFFSHKSQVVFWTTLEVVFLETNSARLNLIVRCFPLIWLMGVHAENCYIRDTNRTHSLTPLLIFLMDNGPKKLKIFGMWCLVVQLILSLKSVEMVKIVGSCCLSVIISSSSSLSRRILSERGAVWEGSQGGEE